MALINPRVASKLTLDSIVSLLDKTLFHPIGASLLSFLLYTRAKNAEALGFTFKQYLEVNSKLKYLLILVGIKTLNRIFTRLALNNGWKRDRPRWRTGQEVVVITGGAGGIGAELVDLIAKKTNKIAVIDLVSPQYKAKNVNFYECDITSTDKLGQVAKQIRFDLGQPTILVNNAGIARGGKILDVTSEEFLKTYKVNTLGAFHILKEFLPHIVNINHGHIMTVASAASYMTIAQLGEYAASKSAVLSLHEALRIELVHRYNAPKVRTSIICPTKVDTQLGRGMADSPNPFITPVLTPQQVAQEMFNVIDSGLSDHKIMPLYAGMLPFIRAFPEWFRWVINTAGKTHETVTDESSDNARKGIRVAPSH